MTEQDFVSEWEVGGTAGGHRVCIGGVCWDHYLRIAALEVGGKNPLLAGRLRLPGGGAANTALGHRRLAPGTRVVLLAQVGDCPDGLALRRQMAAEDVEMPLPAVAGAETSVSYIATEAAGRSTFFVHPGAREEPLPLEAIEAVLPDAAACCLVGHVVNGQMEPILRIAQAHGVPVFFAPCRAQIEGLGYRGLGDALAEGVELLICNRKEARQLTGTNEVATQLDALRFGDRVRTVVVTDGADGLHALTDGGCWHEPAYRDPARSVVDDAGAGDAAHAAIVDALLRGYSLEVALAAGARQGFEACTAMGTTTQLLPGPALRAYLASRPLAA